MKATIKRKEFYNALSSIKEVFNDYLKDKAIVNTNFKVHNGFIEINVSLFNESLSINIECDHIDAFNFDINFIDMFNMIKSIKAKEFTIEYEKDSTTIKVNGYNIYLLKNEFESIDYDKTDTLFFVDGNEYIKTVDKVLKGYKLWNDNLRPTLNSVGLNVDNDNLDIVTSNGLVLSVSSIDKEFYKGEINFLPIQFKYRKFINLIAKDENLYILNDNAEHLYFIKSSKGFLKFYENKNYPNYIAVIPTAQTDTIEINVSDFLGLDGTDKDIEKLLFKIKNGLVEIYDFEYRENKLFEVEISNKLLNTVLGMNKKLLIQTLKGYKDKVTLNIYGDRTIIFDDGSLKRLLMLLLIES